MMDWMNLAGAMQAVMLATGLALGLALGYLLFPTMRRAGRVRLELEQARDEGKAAREELDQATKDLAATRAELLATREELAASRGEHERYRGTVSEHFVRTADLVGEMTRSYAAVYDHLSAGARSFAGDAMAGRAVDFGPSPAALASPLAADTAVQDLEETAGTDEEEERGEAPSLDSASGTTFADEDAEEDADAARRPGGEAADEGEPGTAA